MKSVVNKPNYISDVCFKSNQIEVGRLSVRTSQVARRAGAYPGFCSMKRPGVFLLPPGWDASPTHGYPQH